MKPQIATSPEGFAVCVYDLRDVEPDLLPSEWSPAVQRAPEDAKGVCLHSAWSRSFQVNHGDRVRFGLIEAQARKGLSRSAHITCGLAGDTPFVAIIHPVDRYTMHGGLANGAYLGLEVQGDFPFEESHRTVKHTPVSPKMKAAVQVALAVAKELLDAWAGPAQWELLTHRQAGNGSHDDPKDPGEAVVAVACDGLEGHYMADPDRVLDPEHGLGWPDSWRTHLEFDQVFGLDPGP